MRHTGSRTFKGFTWSYQQTQNEVHLVQRTVAAPVPPAPFTVNGHILFVFHPLHRLQSYNHWYCKHFSINRGFVPWKVREIRSRCRSGVTWGIFQNPDLLRISSGSPAVSMYSSNRKIINLKITMNNVKMGLTIIRQYHLKPKNENKVMLSVNFIPKISI